MKHTPGSSLQVAINLALIVVLFVIDSPFHLCRRAVQRLRLRR